MQWFWKDGTYKRPWCQKIVHTGLDGASNSWNFLYHSVIYCKPYLLLATWSLTVITWWGTPSLTPKCLIWLANITITWCPEHLFQKLMTSCDVTISAAFLFLASFLVKKIASRDGCFMLTSQGSWVGSMPVGLWAHEWRSTIAPGVADFNAAIIPSKSNDKVAAFQ